MASNVGAFIVVNPNNKTYYLESSVPNPGNSVNQDVNETFQVLEGLGFRRVMDDAVIQVPILASESNEMNQETANPVSGGFGIPIPSFIPEFFKQFTNPQAAEDEPLQDEAVDTEPGWMNKVSVSCSSVTLAGIAVRIMFIAGPDHPMTIWDAVVIGTASAGFVFSWNSERLKGKNIRASNTFGIMGSAATSTSIAILSSIFLPTKYVFIPIVFGLANLVCYYYFK